MRTGLFTRIRLFLIVILSAVNVYFGGCWIYSRYIFDYRDMAWKQVSSSFSSNWAFAMDKIEEKTNSVEWMRGAKRKIKEGWEKITGDLGLSSERMRCQKRMADARKRIFGKGKQQEASVEKSMGKKEDINTPGKKELLTQAKKMGLGPRASELYAGNETTEVMERLRKKDLDFYSLWLLYSFSANFALIISLFFFGARIRLRRGRDYVGLEDD